MKRGVFIFLFLVLGICKGFTQVTSGIESDLGIWINDQFAFGMDSFNIPGATLVLVQGDSILHIKGYGVENLETNTTVSSKTSIFSVASVSKTFVGTAIMQLWEEGKLKLDEDVNAYLDSFEIENKFGKVVTIKDLLTHTAGFDERNIFTSVKTKSKVIPLEDYLKKRMPPQIRASGEALT